MIGEGDLQAAVSEGIIDQAQAVRIAHLTRMRQATAIARHDAVEPATIDPDDERFRLIGGFNDVFVAIGVCLLAGALLGLARVLGFGNAFAGVALLAAWGLSEIFARRMRLALPSILLAVMFAGSAAWLASPLATDLRTEAAGGAALGAGAIGFAIVIASRLHRWRFGVPINSAITAIGCIALLFGLLIMAPYHLSTNWIAVIVGLIVFAVAMRTDMGDPQRLTRRSDSAFWLHLLAAPLIVHPMIQLVTSGISQTAPLQAVVILVLFMVFGLIALVIDRRALLVSGLSYAGIAIAYLLTQRVSGGLDLPLTLLGLAVVVLGLSVGWRSLRARLVPLLPLGRLRERLPPIALPETR
ncbi:hypothetical protein [Bosea sp. 685]|uniref:hypothetical protein n=1 Tax=Bosea sp. 685 TaxID=3080057 RepID=UPI002892E054|nr:hypothetical protein [Bosea sp. 685]WNJ90650.1 hypothetical protein RMR04_30505 [Bosea sp. 685]